MTTDEDLDVPAQAADDAGALSFEDAFAALSEVVASLEAGGLPIEESLALYAKGVALAARCGQVLDAVQTRVRAIDGEGRDAGPLEP